MKPSFSLEHKHCRECGKTEWAYENDYGRKTQCKICKTPAPEYQITDKEIELLTKGRDALNQNDWIASDRYFKQYVSEYPESPYGYLYLSFSELYISTYETSDAGNKIKHHNIDGVPNLESNQNFKEAIKLFNKYKSIEEEAHWIKASKTLLKSNYLPTDFKEPYKVFLSFKSDSEDEKIADTIYGFLLKELGYKEDEVFHFKRTNNNSEYAPRIQHALRKASMFVLIGTTIDHLKSTWVSHEYTTYLREMEKNNKDYESLFVIIPNFKDLKNSLPSSLIGRDIMDYKDGNFNKKFKERFKNVVNKIKLKPRVIIQPSPLHNGSNLPVDIDLKRLTPETIQENTLTKNKLIILWKNKKFDLLKTECNEVIANNKPIYEAYKYNFFIQVNIDTIDKIGDSSWIVNKEQIDQLMVFLNHPIKLSNIDEASKKDLPTLFISILKLAKGMLNENHPMAYYLNSNLLIPTFQENLELYLGKQSVDEYNQVLFDLCIKNRDAKLFKVILKSFPEKVNQQQAKFILNFCRSVQDHDLSEIFYPFKKIFEYYQSLEGTVIDALTEAKDPKESFLFKNRYLLLKIAHKITIVICSKIDRIAKEKNQELWIKLTNQVERFYNDIKAFNDVELIHLTRLTILLELAKFNHLKEAKELGEFIIYLTLKNEHKKIFLHYFRFIFQYQINNLSKIPSLNEVTKEEIQRFYNEIFNVQIEGERPTIIHTVTKHVLDDYQALENAKNFVKSLIDYPPVFEKDGLLKTSKKSDFALNKSKNFDRDLFGKFFSLDKKGIWQYHRFFGLKDYPNSIYYFNQGGIIYRDLFKKIASIKSAKTKTIILDKGVVLFTPSQQDDVPDLTKLDIQVIILPGVILKYWNKDESLGYQSFELSRLIKLSEIRDGFNQVLYNHSFHGKNNVYFGVPGSRFQEAKNLLMQLSNQVLLNLTFTQEDYLFYHHLVELKDEVRQWQLENNEVYQQIKSYLLDEMEFESSKAYHLFILLTLAEHEDPKKGILACENYLVHSLLQNHLNSLALLQNLYQDEFYSSVFKQKGFKNNLLWQIIDDYHFEKLMPEVTKVNNSITQPIALNKLDNSKRKINLLITSLATNHSSESQMVETWNQLIRFGENGSHYAMVKVLPLLLKPSSLKFLNAISPGIKEARLISYFTALAKVEPYANEQLLIDLYHFAEKKITSMQQQNLYQDAFLAFIQKILSIYDEAYRVNPMLKSSTKQQQKLLNDLLIKHS